MGEGGRVDTGGDGGRWRVDTVGDGDRWEGGHRW